MPGPIYTAGRTPLNSTIGAAGGSLEGLSQTRPTKSASVLISQPSTSVARTPPTLIAFQQTADWQNTTTPRDIGSALTWQTGDIIVVVGVAESEAIDLNTPTATGLTFSPLGTASTFGNSTWMHRWVATAGSSGSGIVSITRVASGLFGAGVWQYRGSEGIGATPAIQVSVNVKTAPITETKSNSAIIAVLGDWGAGSTSSPTWTPAGATQRIATDGAGSTYSVLGADWADAGSASTTNYGLTAGLSTTQNIAIAVIEVLGTDSVGGPTEVFGSAALSSESTLDTVGTVATTATSALSAQSNMTVVGTRVVFGSAALSIESNVSVIGSNNVRAASVLSGQSTMNTVAANTVMASVAFSGQSNVTAIGSNTVFASSAESIQSNLSVTGIALTTGNTALSIQSNLGVTGFATAFGLASLTSTLTMVTAGIVGTLPPTVTLQGDLNLTVIGSNNVRAGSILSGQSTLNTIGSNNVRAASVLSAQSTLDVISKVTTSGIAALSAQANMNTVATTSTTPPNVSLSAQSNMTVVGAVTVRGIIAFSIESNINTIGRNNTTGVIGLSAQSSITTIGTRGVNGAAALSIQSVLTASGIIPAIVTGSAALTIQSGLSVTGNPTPPWTFAFIEFSNVQVIGVDKSKTVSISPEFTSRVSSFEGG